MNRNTLTRIATITATIAGVSLLIAGVIGVTSGAFQTMASGTFRLAKKGGAGSVAIDEKKSIPVAGIQSVTIDALGENITIHEWSGESITARFHGNVSSISSDNRPHLQVDQVGDEAGIRIERHQHIMVGRICNEETALEISIPKQYAGKLSAKGISADITLGSHCYRELALTTVSGNIEADAINAAIGNVDAHSVSGDVALSFTKMPGSINIKTISGDIRLGMPSNAGFTLDAHSTSGDITYDFPVTLTRSRTGDSKHSLGGTVGSGKGIVTVRTVSGDIGITRNGGI